jgi:hypothetical protein
MAWCDVTLVSDSALGGHMASAVRAACRCVRCVVYACEMNFVLCARAVYTRLLHCVHTHSHTVTHRRAYLSRTPRVCEPLYEAHVNVSTEMLGKAFEVLGKVGMCARLSTCRLCCRLIVV